MLQKMVAAYRIVSKQQLDLFYIGFAGNNKPMHKTFLLIEERSGLTITKNSKGDFHEIRSSF
jgi:hypothetical protein